MLSERANQRCVPSRYERSDTAAGLTAAHSTPVCACEHALWLTSRVTKQLKAGLLCLSADGSICRNDSQPTATFNIRMCAHTYLTPCVHFLCSCLSCSVPQPHITTMLQQQLDCTSELRTHTHTYKQQERKYRLISHSPG